MRISDWSSDVCSSDLITDELTGYAVDWLKQQGNDNPFMLYLSHKGVHADFLPAERHAGKFKDHRFNAPSTMMIGSHMNALLWVRNQLNSLNGIEFPYQRYFTITAFYKTYRKTFTRVN